MPGHWEGDMLMGRRQTTIGTLVERWSRYVMLFGLPDGNTAEAVRPALVGTVQRLRESLIPVMLRKINRVCGTEDIRFAVTRKRSLPVWCSAMATPMI